MAEKTLDDIVRRLDALEKKFFEMNYPYHKPPYPCVVEYCGSFHTEEDGRPENRRSAWLLSDGQIKFTYAHCYGNASGSFDTAPTTLGNMAVRAGVELEPADMKKKTVVSSKIFEKFGGMKWAYMGQFILADWGNLYSVISQTPQQVLDEIERETARLGEPFKSDPSASEWDNIKAAVSACKRAEKRTGKS